MNWYSFVKLAQRTKSRSYMGIGHSYPEFADIWWIDKGQLMIESAFDEDTRTWNDHPVLSASVEAKGRIDYEDESISIVLGSGLQSNQKSYFDTDFMDKQAMRIAERLIRRKPEIAGFDIYLFGQGKPRRLASQQNNMRKAQEKINYFKNNNHFKSAKFLAKKAERALYHGTIIDHADSIREIGLIPELGTFIQNAYGGEYEAAGIKLEDEITPLSYATDKQDFDKAVTAMTYHIAQKLDKAYHDVTLQDIRNHGLIVKIKGWGGSDEPPSPWERRPEEYDSDWEMMAADRGLYAVEPGDYYTEYGTGGEHKGDIQLLMGPALIRLLKRRKII